MCILNLIYIAQNVSQSEFLTMLENSFVALAQHKQQLIRDSRYQIHRPRNIATKNIYGSADAMVASLLPGMVVSMLLGINTLNPSIAVEMIIEGICECQCSSFKSLWPCSYKQSMPSCLGFYINNFVGKNNHTKKRSTIRYLMNKEELWR